MPEFVTALTGLPDISLCGQAQRQDPEGREDQRSDLLASDDGSLREFRTGLSSIMFSSRQPWRKTKDFDTSVPNTAPSVQRTGHDAEQAPRRTVADHPGVMAPRGVVAEHHEHAPRHHRVIGVRAWRRHSSWPAVARESGDPFDQPVPLPRRPARRRAGPAAARPRPLHDDDQPGSQLAHLGPADQHPGPRGDGRLPAVTGDLDDGQPAPHQEDAERGHGKAGGHAQARGGAHHYRAAVPNSAVRSSRRVSSRADTPPAAAANTAAAGPGGQRSIPVPAAPATRTASRHALRVRCTPPSGARPPERKQAHGAATPRRRATATPAVSTAVRAAAAGSAATVRAGPGSAPWRDQKVIVSAAAHRPATAASALASAAATGPVSRRLTSAVAASPAL